MPRQLSWHVQNFVVTELLKFDSISPGSKPDITVSISQLKVASHGCVHGCAWLCKLTSYLSTRRQWKPCKNIIPKICLLTIATKCYVGLTPWLNNRTHHQRFFPSWCRRRTACWFTLAVATICIVSVLHTTVDVSLVQSRPLELQWKFSVGSIRGLP